MKILYHHRIRSKDGQFVHIEELTEAMKSLGHEIVFVGPRAVHSEKFGADAGAVAWLKKLLPGALYELLELAYSLGDFVRLVRVILAEQPDVIYERYNLYFLSGAWARRFFRTPLLLEVNAPLFEERSKFGGLAIKWLARRTETAVWRRADHVFAVTEVLAKRVRSVDVPSERVSIVPNGIDWAKFEEADDGAQLRREFGYEGRIVVGFTGFAREWHGLDELTKVVAQDPRLVLLVVGDGPARGPTEKLARQLGVADRVRFTGVVERHEVARYVGTFDIAMQPDVVEYASPLKLIEYLALGRAIVAPDSANIRELLTHNANSLLFPSGERDQMCAQIRQLCDDTELRRRLGVAARQTVFDRDLTWIGNAKRVIAVAERMLALSRASGPRAEQRAFGRKS